MPARAVPGGTAKIELVTLKQRIHAEGVDVFDRLLVKAAARNSPARSTSTSTAFNMPLATTLPEIRFTPSPIETTCGTGGPAGMMRTHAGGQSGWPVDENLHRHEAGAQPFRQRGIHLRDAVVRRFADIAHAACAADPPPMPAY